MTYKIACPHCARVYGELDTQAVFNLNNTVCEGCGRKFRVNVRLAEEVCDTCGHSHECENTIERVMTEPWCNEKYSPHHYQPTLATNVQKCMKCNDIKTL